MVSANSDPSPPERPWVPPPRSALGMRQLVGALLLLLPVILVFGGLSRCSFSPAGPSVEPGAGPTVDAPAMLRDLAPQVPFALRIPAVPPGWRSNAVDQVGIDGGRAVHTGYVTGAGRYLRLVQSDASEQALLLDAVGSVPTARGAVEVAGQRWVVYGAVAGGGTGRAAGDEQVWVADIAGVRLLVTGSGDETEFRTLATATLAGVQLAAGTAPR